MTDAGRLIVGDCLETMRALPARSVHCCVTSPPYWGLRDYGMDGQVGLEATPSAYVEKLVRVFREVRRVLREDGTVWLNLGDSYAQRKGSGYVKAGHGKGDEHAQRHVNLWASTGAEDLGIRERSLVGIPWLVAVALQADGWVLRSDVIWAKRNMLPESVAGWRWEPCRRKQGSRRARDQKYAAGAGHRDKRHGDLQFQQGTEWAACPGCDRCRGNGGLVLRRGSWRPTRSHEYVFQLGCSTGYFGDGDPVREANKPDPPQRGQKVPLDLPAGRNLRDVWFLASQPSKLHHFAMMPPLLVEKCLKSSCPTHVCAACGTPWARVVNRGTILADAQGFRATCGCGAGAVPGTVLDPFLGAGTVAGVADHLGLRWVGCELNPKYAKLLPDRVAEVRGYYARRAGRAPRPQTQGREQLGFFGASA